MERANNNVGLIIPGIAPLRDTFWGKWLWQNPKMFDDLKVFMDEIHKTDTKLFVQLTADEGLDRPCGNQSNQELYGKPLKGKALCLPQTIGSTTGGLVLYCACAMDRQPAGMLFANHIDSLAAADAILADVWLDNVSMPVVDCLGEEFLSYVKDGMTITVKEDGVIVVAKFDGGDQLGQCISGCDFG